MKFYKKDLITAVANTNNWTTSDAERAVNAVVSEITKCLKSGNDIQITGFGTFSTTERKATKITGFNGDVIKIKKHKIPTFRAGEMLRKAVNKRR